MEVISRFMGVRCKRNLRVLRYTFFVMLYSYNIFGLELRSSKKSESSKAKIIQPYLCKLGKPYSFQRSPINFTIEDLEVSSDNDTSYEEIPMNKILQGTKADHSVKQLKKVWDFTTSIDFSLKIRSTIILHT